MVVKQLAEQRSWVQIQPSVIATQNIDQLKRSIRKGSSLIDVAPAGSKLRDRKKTLTQSMATKSALVMADLMTGSKTLMLSLLTSTMGTKSKSAIVRKLRTSSRTIRENQTVFVDKQILKTMSPNYQYD